MAEAALPRLSLSRISHPNAAMVCRGCAFRRCVRAEEWVLVISGRCGYVREDRIVLCKRRVVAAVPRLHGPTRPFGSAQGRQSTARKKKSSHSARDDRFRNGRAGGWAEVSAASAVSCAGRENLLLASRREDCWEGFSWSCHSPAGGSERFVRGFWDRSSRGTLRSWLGLRRLPGFRSCAASDWKSR
jgi:hypothetical protein